MTQVKFKNKKGLQRAKDKLSGAVSLHKMKDGRVVAVKWPTKKSQKIINK